MANATQDVQDFYSGVVGDQNAGAPELLPTDERKGAPKGALYLFTMEDDSVELKHSGEESKNPNHPYVAFRAEVIGPDEFEDSFVRGMFYFPALPDDTADSKAMQKFNKQLQRTIGQVEGILGEGTIESIGWADGMENMCETLVDMLDGASFVGKVGVEKASGGYNAKNRINEFFASSTWSPEE